MAEPDGSVRIGVIMNTDAAKKKLEELRTRLVSETKEVDAQAKAVDRLQAKYDKLVSGGAEPRGIKKLESELKKAQAEAAKLDEEFQRLTQMAELDRAASGSVSPGTAQSLKEVQSNLTAADMRVDELNRKLLEMKTPPESSEEARKLAEELDAARKRLEEMQTAAHGTADRINSLEGAVQSWPARMGQAVSSAGAAIGRAVKSSAAAVGTLKKRISGLGRERGFEKASSGASRLGKRLKSLVAGALFFNIISRGLTELTKQIGSYLTANREFSTALGSIKSNLLTAFQPIYDKIIPALNTLMSALKQASAQAAVFIAQVFGTTAQKAQQDAEALKEKADAIKETGDAAKKAEKDQKKYLASFDTIEKLGENEQEEEKPEEDAAAKFDTDFSQIKLPEWLVNFWEPIKTSWDEVGGATVEAVKASLGSIWDLLKSIGQTFLDMWNSVAGITLLNNLQLLLQTILGIIHDIAAAFKAAWEGGTGEAVISALFYMINSVLELLISVGQAFREAWNDNGRGEEICRTILQIVANIFEIVGNLANRFKEAWEANDNGVAIWGAILDIIQDVLDFFEEITAATARWTEGLDLEPIVSAFRKLLETVEPLVDTILDGLSWAWENVLLPLAGWVIEDAAPAAINVLTKALEALNKILNALSPVFMALWENILKPLASFIGKVFVAALNALAEAIEWIGNLLTGLIQTLSDAASRVAEFFGASGSSKSAGFSGGSSSRAAAYSTRMAYAGDIAAYNLADLPHLAQGAVISPNSEFLAVLGDQRNGTNVEAPLGLIEQALENVVARYSGTGGGTNVTVNFTGSLSQLARILQPEITVEAGRIGPNLVKG